ncbi:DUF2213 domain-containing protein [Acinetobacter nectaris]|uniref:DUF2213 domain-containing protein n=1 Tax=Acinetobacter nectaris TaxID=1219382 RepID=UPI001F2E6763|nr:DUF2213 domain-containing protein [Acinetobacter nectaris]MCF9034209.1 DUF2213 domain-containing protein [Acinetobacter nectaris]
MKIPTNELLALDRTSVRSMDGNGYLRVKKSNISKANICEYKGKEIPNWRELGLNAEQMYRLYRDPEELRKSIDSFKNVPLVRQHVGAFNTHNPPKDDVIGSVGSDVDFNGIYLTSDIIVTDAAAISLIESEQQKELSPGYRYTADMTAGEVNGEKYDGVMRNIVGNHLALVEIGRTGSDVVVGDSQPKEGNIPMNIEDLKKALEENPELKKQAKELLGQDEGNDDAKKKTGEDDDDIKKKPGEDDDDKNKEPPANDDDDDGKKKTGEDGDDDDKNKPAMDAALIEQRVSRRIEDKFKQLREAERITKPLCGELACDSAEQLYRTALDGMGVSHKGIDSVLGLKSLTEAIVQNKQQQQSMAQDSATRVNRGGLGKAMPNFSKFQGQGV